MPNFIDLKGFKTGRLTIIERGPNYQNPNIRPTVRWWCLCDCGNKTLVHANAIRRKGVKSCGCLAREVSAKSIRKMATTHGECSYGKRTKEVTTWNGIKRRCLSPNATGYKLYGGRGIKICERWLKYENFLEDMGRKPHPKMQIDRIDNNGNYEPGNCRWVFPIVQNNNKRNTLYFEYNGERLTIREWSNRTGLSYRIIDERIRKEGWSIEKTITTPKREQ